MMPYTTAKAVPGNTNFDHGGEAGDHSVISKIVASHGPALSHQHISDGQSHMVFSQHPDGHQHISTGHPSFGHALEHIGIAHGADQ